MTDVLEHVDDDLELLRFYVGSAAEGLQVLISVPAFSAMWSGHDEFLGHKRRYTLKQVTDLAEHAGLRVVKARYFFGLLLPGVAAVRLWSRYRRRSRGGWRRRAR
jgi:hypothetical protein